MNFVPSIVFVMECVLLCYTGEPVGHGRPGALHGHDSKLFP